MNFISNRDELDKIKNYFKKSREFNITANDIYFGIGLLTTVQEKISDYPGLKFGLTYIRKDSFGNKIKENMPLVPCDPEYFYYKEEWNKQSNETKVFLKTIIPMYLCPNISTYNQKLTPYQYLQNYTYMEFNVQFINDSVINSTMDLIIQKQPRVQFIWSGLTIDSSSKIQPYSSFIDFMQSSLHTNELEEIDIFFQTNTI